MKVAFFLLVGALICSVHAYNWTIVDNDYATIALACRFQTATNGWVVGGSGSLQPLLLHTTDGAKTFNNSGLTGTNVGALMSLDMANSQYGIAGALGFLDLPCGAYMTDGATWQQTHQGKEIICSSQDSVNTDGGKTMIIVGQWAEVTNFGGDGLQISLDAGSTWTSCPWNQGTESRYAWFSSANQGYVTGGTWPEESSEKPEQLTLLNRIPKPLTRRLTYTGLKGVEFKQRPHSTVANVTGYQAILASASNNGKTFNTLINMTNQGVYFNQISCIDSQNCWACAEGINKTNGYDAAYIYQTSNGWKTWSTQLYVEGGSLVAVTMLNSTYGWAGGALIEEESVDASGSPRSSFNGQFYLTTDGKTWVLNQQVRNFYVMDISVVDSTSAYAAGITSLGLSSLAKYS